LGSGRLPIVMRFGQVAFPRDGVDYPRDCRLLDLRRGADRLLAAAFAVYLTVLISQPPAQLA